MYKAIETRLLSKLALGALIIAIANCTTPRKLIEQGHYDQAIEKLIKSLQGKEKKSPKKVRLLELTFNKAQERDVEEINRLMLEGKDENWPKIYDIYDRIDRRQKRLRPLVPLVDKKGREARLSFMFNLKYLDTAKHNAKEKAIQYLYTHARELLYYFHESEPKKNCRKAYYLLQQLHQKFGEYKDSKNLMIEAHKCGTTYYHIEVKNESGVPFSGYWDYFLSQPPQLFGRWVDIYPYYPELITFDNHIYVIVKTIELTPFLEREREVTYERQIKVKDRHSDTTRLVKVKARVLEISDYWKLSLGGEVQIFSLRPKKELLFREPFYTKYEYKAFGIKLLEGDARAIPDNKRAYLNRSLPPYYSNLELVNEALKHMNRDLYRVLSKYEGFYDE